MLPRLILLKKNPFVLLSIRETTCLMLMHEMHIKGFINCKAFCKWKALLWFPDTIWMQLTSTAIHPSCRYNDQHKYFPLFLCHGRGRMSEPNTEITAVIFMETSERISKAYMERIATDRFSLGQPHYYFLRLWKGKVLTDLLEVTLVFSPPVHRYCHRMRRLSPTRTVGDNFAIQSKGSVSLCQGSGVCIWFTVRFSIRLPPWLPEFPAQRAYLGSLSFQQK